METIPLDVTETVRVAADAARAYPGSLGDVRHRVRRRRARRIAAAAATAVVTVLAGVGLAVQPPERESPPADGPVWEQRLVLLRAYGVYHPVGGRDPVRLDPSTIGELMPDGRLVAHQLPGLESAMSYEPLPGGGFLIFDSFREPARLTVVGADGTVRISRDVSGQDVGYGPMAATATTVSFWRGPDLVTQDLSTGGERTVISKPAMRIEPAEEYHGSLDMVGDRVVASVKRDRCDIDVYDDAGRTHTRSLPDESSCRRIKEFTLSPDGSMLAAVHWIHGEEKTLGTMVVRLADGKVLAKGARIPDPNNRYPIVRLAWQDDHTVRGVTYDSPVTDTEIRPFTLSW
jgi:hypothetical protein